MSGLPEIGSRGASERGRGSGNFRSKGGRNKFSRRGGEGRGGTGGSYRGRGGFGVRGSHGESRGGRGNSDGGYRGGRGKWQQSPSSTSSASLLPQKSADEVINYWSNNDAVRLPSPPPVKFEPPETDFHLQVTQEQHLWRESRNLLVGFNGHVLSDCRGTHNTVDDMCQFCDSRRGKWAVKNPPQDSAFKRYQDDLIASRNKYAARLDVDGDANQPRDGPTFLQLVPESEAIPLFDDEDFGLERCTEY